MLQQGNRCKQEANLSEIRDGGQADTYQQRETRRSSQRHSLQQLPSNFPEMLKQTQTMHAASCKSLSHVESACVAGAVNAAKDDLSSIECSLIGVQPNRELVVVELPAIDHVPEGRVAASFIGNLWKGKTLHPCPSNQQQYSRSTGLDRFRTQLNLFAGRSANMCTMSAPHACATETSNVAIHCKEAMCIGC